MVEGSQKNNIFPFEENEQPIHRLYLTMAPIWTDLYFLVGYLKVDDPSKTISTVYLFDMSATGRGGAIFVGGSSEHPSMKNYTIYA